ncbi:MAG: hypothetical protein K9L02_05880 [Acholeplasmataceae bacterium]|nr:hypothetical protein [Acholeplasmataceae bacterium]
MSHSSKKFVVIVTILITVITLGFSLILVLNSLKEAEFIIDEQESILEITGMYKKTILIDQNTEINLVSPITITKRTNGSSTGDIKKGYFTLEGDLAVYLNLGDSSLDWIEIINGDDYYYINYKAESDTLQLLQDLIDLQS